MDTESIPPDGTIFETCGQSLFQVYRGSFPTEEYVRYKVVDGKWVCESVTPKMEIGGK
jgi:hypothetical protein